MTEWRTFDTEPEQGQSIFIAYQSSRGGICFIHSYYHGEIGAPMIYWMPAPPLPDEEPPKPKFEVPKDALSYLCWVKNYGMQLVFWREAFYCYFVLGDSAAISEHTILAYMDRDGNWVKRDE